MPLEGPSLLNLHMFHHLLHAYFQDLALCFGDPWSLLWFDQSVLHTDFQTGGSTFDDHLPLGVLQYRQSHQHLQHLSFDHFLCHFFVH